MFSARLERCSCTAETFEGDGHELASRLPPAHCVLDRPLQHEVPIGTINPASSAMLTKRSGRT